MPSKPSPSANPGRVGGSAGRKAASRPRSAPGRAASPSPRGSPRTGSTSGKPAIGEHLQHHKDGSLWARGPLRDGQPHGYWEWYRRDGTRLRSGHFERGMQTGEWTTYDRTGAVYKVTRIRPPQPAAGIPP